MTSMHMGIQLITTGYSHCVKHIYIYTIIEEHSKKVLKYLLTNGVTHGIIQSTKGKAP